MTETPAGGSWRSESSGGGSVRVRYSNRSRNASTLRRTPRVSCALRDSQAYSSGLRRTLGLAGVLQGDLPRLIPREFALQLHRFDLVQAVLDLFADLPRSFPALSELLGHSPNRPNAS